MEVGRQRVDDQGYDENRHQLETQSEYGHRNRAREGHTSRERKSQKRDQRGQHRQRCDVAYNQTPRGGSLARNVTPFIFWREQHSFGSTQEPRPHARRWCGWADTGGSLLAKGHALEIQLEKFSIFSITRKEDISRHTNVAKIQK